MRCSRVTFLCGRAGVSALGAVVAKHIGDQSLLNNYLEQFKEVLYLVIYHQDLMIFLIFTWCPDFKLFFNCFFFMIWIVFRAFGLWSLDHLPLPLLTPTTPYRCLLLLLTWRNGRGLVR